MNKLYTIFYDYLDKRGYRRTKKLVCCGIERLREQCIDITKLSERQPIDVPIIYETIGIDIYGETLDFDDIIKG